MVFTAPTRLEAESHAHGCTLWRICGPDPTTRQESAPVGRVAELAAAWTKWDAELIEAKWIPQRAGKAGKGAKKAK